MSLDRSWWGGEAEFEYIDEDEEYARMVVTNKDKWQKLFDTFHEELSKVKQSDRQTSNSPGKTGPGKFHTNLTSVIVPKQPIKTNFENGNRMSLNCGFVARL